MGDRSKGTRLGLKLDLQVSTKSLFIKEVLGGLAFAWNSTHPDSKIRPGDRIIRVNKAQGDAHSLFDECKKSEPLELELRRGSAVPIAVGLHSIVKTGFANLEEGQEGDVVKVDEDGDSLMKFIGGSCDGKCQWVCRQDYDKFIFEDSDRYYLKRYSDFKELHTNLKTKVDAGSSPIKQLPSMPDDERFGFRRTMSSMGMGSFNLKRKEGLQTAVDMLLKQLPLLESEPALAQFFGQSPLPDVSATTKELLKERLAGLIAKHRKSEVTIKK